MSINVVDTMDTNRGMHVDKRKRGYYLCHVLQHTGHVAQWQWKLTKNPDCCRLDKCICWLKQLKWMHLTPNRICTACLQSNSAPWFGYIGLTKGKQISTNNHIPINVNYYLVLQIKKRNLGNSSLDTWLLDAVEDDIL